MKSLKLWLGVALGFLLIASLFILYGQFTTKKDSHRRESRQDFVSSTQIVTSEPIDAAKVTSTNPTKAESNIPSDIVFTSTTLTFDSEWVLDIYDYQEKGPYVIFSAYKDADKYYGIFRFDRATNEVKTLYSQVKQMGAIGYPSFNSFSFARIRVSPDEQKFFFVVPPTFYFSKNIIVMDMEGREVSFTPPEKAEQLDWFKNTHLSYRPPLSYREKQYLEIIDITTGVTSTTKIPLNDWSSNQQVNPSATAYAVVEAHQGKIFGQEYTCAGFYVDMVVYSYPDGKELFRIKDLHGAYYRWLSNGELQYVYQKISPEDLQNCKDIKSPIERGIYTPN